MSHTNLFAPLKMGSLKLSHRIAMAPLTRLRATDARVPAHLMQEYYSQRASTPGTLLISEGTCVSPTGAGGFANAPGIWSAEQVEGWKAITEEVHRKGCYIVCQLFAMGRAADEEIAKSEGVEVLGPSAIPIEFGSTIPRGMTLEEIRRSIGEFTVAAQNAIAAGFDGVEIHGANGYLIDQFIQDTSNQRGDIYGGSIENRSRFLVEILTAVVQAIGAERVGLRLSPWSTFQGMRMADPVPQFEDITLKARDLQLAYLHVVESRISGSEDVKGQCETLDFLYNLWPGTLLVAGGYTLAEALRLVDQQFPDRNIIVVFGRHFLANPDLVYRFREGLELNNYVRKTFYTPQSPVGYVDYPFSPAYLASQSV